MLQNHEDKVVRLVVLRVVARRRRHLGQSEVSIVCCVLCGPITAHLGLHYWDGVVVRLLHGAGGLAPHLVAAEHRHPGLVTQVTRLGLGQSGVG